MIHRRRSKFRYVAVLIAVAVMAYALYAFKEGSEETVSPELAILLEDNTYNPFDTPGDSAPDAGCVPLRTRVPKVPLGRLFNDLQDAHLVYARSCGIVPVTDSRSAWNNTRGIVEVRSDSTMFIDELTHSYPYLRRPAAALLHEIGRRFHDSLQARGGGDYRLKVTSLLRTDATVGRLRRVNRNAVSESAHSYGTTFDISYSKFICDDISETHRTFEDLKNLLAEVVNDLRDEGRCMVKREVKQACFHITATDSI